MYSSIEKLSDDKNVIINKVSNLDFFKNTLTDFTVEEVKILIRLLFLTKAKSYNYRFGTGTLKHLFENISKLVINSKTAKNNKYCCEQIVIDAFEQEGFKLKEDNGSHYINIKNDEMLRAFNLFADGKYSS